MTDPLSAQIAVSGISKALRTEGYEDDDAEKLARIAHAQSIAMLADELRLFRARQASFRLRVTMWLFFGAALAAGGSILVWSGSAYGIAVSFLGLIGALLATVLQRRHYRFVNAVMADYAERLRAFVGESEQAGASKYSQLEAAEDFAIAVADLTAHREPGRE
ncbi:hypothetical protein [Mycolicibacterium smegmatis]|uniref:Transmembrane protein n=1 Tax=Mycolicibacterium smegmatis (strain MKD8) TaxID=1214915 RepID=A0A2U9PVK1_MYCSE|nr:hypothetical protein [Mycolicibacterium smegmatis]AWT55812.1 hypothetical protein D806_048610 [Mycolicibacterium smegmatis MKD8]